MRRSSALFSAITSLALATPLGCRHAPLPADGSASQLASPSATPAEPPRVIVVGGGIAGLVTAYELEKRGIRSHVLEMSDNWGGRVQTAYYENGLHAEFGMQEMWRGNPLLDIAKELGVELDGEPEPAYSSVYFDEKLHPFVQATTKEYFASFLKPDEVKVLEAWMKDAKALHDEAEKVGLASPRVKALQDLSFQQWLEQSKLPHGAAEWMRLTLECELAGSADEISALAALLEIGIFLDEETPNWHVKAGNSKLIEAIANSLKSEKTLSAMATGVRRWKDANGQPRVEVRYFDAKSRSVKKLEAERVVLAVPFTRLHQIEMDPPMSAERWDAVKTLAFGRYTVVHFIVDKEASKLWEIEGRSVPPVLTDGPLGVIYGVQQKAPEGQPYQIFGLLVYKGEAGSFHMQPRDQKLKELTDELDKLWPGFSSHVKSAHVYTYHPASLAVWPVGRSPLDAGSELLRTPELGTYLAGDWTLGSHSDHAAKSGIRTAKLIADELAAPAPAK